MKNYKVGVWRTVYGEYRINATNEKDVQKLATHLLEKDTPFDVTNDVQYSIEVVEEIK